MIAEMIIALVVMLLRNYGLLLLFYYSYIIVMIEHDAISWFKYSQHKQENEKSFIGSFIKQYPCYMLHSTFYNT